MLIPWENELVKTKTYSSIIVNCKKYFDVNSAISILHLDIIIT